MRRTLTRSEVSHALGISGVSLDKYRKLGLIFATRSKITGWFRYPISEVERFARENDGVPKKGDVQKKDGICTPETDDIVMPVGIVEEE